MGPPGPGSDPQPAQTYSLGEIPPQETCSNLFIILYVAHTSIGKRVVGLRLKGLLVALIFVIMVVIFNR